MRDMFEMLVLMANNKVIICSPGKKTMETDIGKYITTHGGSSGLLPSIYDAIPFILAEGWEPCAYLTGYAMPTYQFRRKIN